MMTLVISYYLGDLGSPVVTICRNSAELASRCIESTSLGMTVSVYDMATDHISEEGTLELLTGVELQQNHPNYMTLRK